jgi:malate dehydrogenase
MGFIAIVGSGALGGAVAHAVAVRDRVTEVRLIDPAGDPAGQVARGKALDIQQSSPIDNFSTALTSAESLDAAVGADVIVIADSAAGNVEHAGEGGLGLLRHLVRGGSRSPILCAGSSQRQLIGRAVSELHIPRGRVVGSAPFALESALRALAGLTLDGSGVEVGLRVVGVPPHAAVVAWEEATAHGQPLASQMAPHAIASLAARIPGLWPPGPFALAAAAARVVEALARGSRRRFSCFVATETGPTRAAVGSMPVELGPQGVIRVMEPALTSLERTALGNALERNAEG